LKRPYKKPTIVEYGPMRQLTLGSGGHSPDNIVIFGQQIATVNNSCSTNYTILGTGLICS
jgi:hypothetical protein